MSEAERASDLALKAADLARSAPEQWRAFLLAFGEYAEGIRDMCVTAQPNNSAFVAQGMAREASKLRDTFGNAVKLADRILASKAASRNK